MQLLGQADEGADHACGVANVIAVEHAVKHFEECIADAGVGVLADVEMRAAEADATQLVGQPVQLFACSACGKVLAWCCWWWWRAVSLSE